MERSEPVRMSFFGVGPRILVPSALLMGLLAVATWICPSCFSLWWMPDAMRLLIGRTLAAIGSLVLVTGLFTLRTAFAEGRLVTWGIYAWVRNPVYTAGLLFLLPSLCFWAGSWLMLFGPLWGIHAFPSIIRDEEAKLEDLFGQEYVAYRARVPALIPRRPPPRSS